MRRISSLLGILLVVLPLICLRCSSFNEMNLTGGAGAGNPGGTVSVALTIKTDSVLAKTAVSSGSGSAQTAIVSGAAPLVIKDLAGLPVTITGVQINSADLRLILDYREDPRGILDSLRERPSYLSSDSQSLVINKRFSFDCLKGDPDSTIPPVTMPVARYTGVMLRFNQELIPVADSVRQNQILIAGSLAYSGKTHRIRIEINRTFSPIYKFAAGIFTLSATDTTHLEIRFNASQWFHNVNFKQLIDLKLLNFDQNGDLVISSGTCRYGVEETESRIRNDFIMSGKLVVY